MPLLKAVATLLFGGLAVVVILVVIGAVLAFSGSPEPCIDRESVPSTAASDELDAAWRAFRARAAAGPAELRVSELQATSRGVAYLDEKDVPVDRLQVYFCPDGSAEASGEIDMAGVSAKVVVKGTLDLSGDEPRIEIESVRAGSLPSAVAKPAVDLILDTGNVRTLDLDVNLTAIEFSDGQATLSGAP